jgi:Zn finger protein HypA/HybF involved in hydrogenase expression
MRRRPQAEITVAALTRHGIDAVEASCARCGDGWHAPITFLPSATTLAKIAALMACPTCGGREVEIQIPVGPKGRSIQ